MGSNEPVHQIDYLMFSVGIVIVLYFTTPLQDIYTWQYFWQCVMSSQKTTARCIEFDGAC
jgi:hypothetical protein